MFGIGEAYVVCCVWKRPICGNWTAWLGTEVLCTRITWVEERIRDGWEEVVLNVSDHTRVEYVYSSR